MVTVVPVSAEGGVLSAIQGSSQHVSLRGDGIAQNLRRHHHGPRGHRTSPSRSGRRLHLHLHHQHQDHHLKGPDSPHGHGDRFPGGKRHHGGPDHGFRGLHGSRGLQDVAVREHGPHFRRIHRSLSPRGMVQNRSSAGSPVSPQRGHRGHRGFRGREGHCDGTLRSVSFRKHHLHNLHSQGLSSGSDRDRSSPLPAAIDQGIEQLGQLSLRV